MLGCARHGHAAIRPPNRLTWVAINSWGVVFRMRLQRHNLLPAGLMVLAAAPTLAGEPSPAPWQTHWPTTVMRAARPSPGSSLPTGAIAPVGRTETGLASFYWQEQMTASGERFDKRAMTAAHKTLPLGTNVRVTHVESGRTVVVRINDRGPFKAGRVIDLSEAAADVLGMRAAGIAKVQLDVVR